MGKSKRRKSQALPDTDLRLPTPQTLWRVGEASGQIETALLEMPNDIKRRLIGSSKLPDAISAARTPAQLVFLAKDVTGVFIPQWRERILAFGPEALPAIVRRLQSSQSISDAIERDTVVERLIGVMPMLGDSAAAALMSCFDSLDIYGQSLACMALGMMRVVEARDVIWRYFERVRDDEDIGYAVGALWGLLDLDDPRADEAIAHLLKHDRDFPEPYGFAARGGGVQSIAPLLDRLVITTESPTDKSEVQDVLMALAGVMARVGEETMRTELSNFIKGTDRLGSMLAGLRDRAPLVSRYFKIFFPDKSPGE